MSAPAPTEIARWSHRGPQIWAEITAQSREDHVVVELQHAPHKGERDETFAVSGSVQQMVENLEDLKQIVEIIEAAIERARKRPAQSPLPEPPCKWCQRILADGGDPRVVGALVIASHRTGHPERPRVEGGD